MTLTITSLFCGAGGDAQGAELVPGVTVRFAANHWQLAVDTHSLNFPHADHDTADISQVNPRRYPRTDLLWGSPECTNHTPAKGRKHAVDAQPDLFGDVLPDEAAERSRATMWDILRFAEVHSYRGIIVENVVQARDWVLWPSWLMGLANLGYSHEVVYMNSMYAQAAGLPAPQSRDRLYVVAWKAGERAPDLARWARPQASCQHCGASGAAVQAWKRGDRARGRYREQYVWRCQRAACRAEVFPRVLPAAAAIDWTLPGELIGARVRPLAPKTLARIAGGLRRYGRPIHLEAAGNTYEHGSYIRAWPVDEPFRTMHTSASKGLAWSGHAMVMRNNTEHGSTGWTCTSTSEPLRTVTTAGHQSLIRWDHMVYGYDSGQLRSVREPLPTQTTVDGDALIGPEVDVHDCTFRMLEPDEIRAAMAFGPGYTVLGNKRERIRQLGNAVTPPAARDLISAIAEAITGEVAA